MSRAMPSEEEMKTIAVSNSCCSSRRSRRICAATVTSSGWVMLSAIRSFGFGHERIDDQGALHHAAAELERKFVETLDRSRDAHRVERVDHALARFARVMPGATAMSFSRI